MFILKRWYFLLLIFVLISSLLIWSSRTQLAEQVISFAMVDAGLTNITANIHQLDINQSIISHLEFSLLTETALLHINAHDISINYKPVKVVEGQIDKLLIDRLIVEYEKTSKTLDDAADSDSALEPVIIIDVLRQAIREYIFFSTVQIQHLTLNGAAFAALDGKSLQLKSTANDKSLTAQITLLNPPATQQFRGLPQLVISNLTEESLNAELKLIDTPIETPKEIPRTISSAISSNTAAKLELTIRDTELSGSYHINLQSLQSWLQAFTDITGFNEVEEVNGTLLFDFAPASKNRDMQNTGKQILATLTAASDKLIYKSYSADNAVIKLKLKTATEKPGQEIQLLNGSYIKADNFSYDDFSLKASHIFMVGELTNATENWLVKGGFRSDLFAANDESHSVQIKDIAARLMASSEKLEVSGNFSAVTVPGKFSFTLKQELANSSGKLSIKPLKALNLNTENSRLSQLLTPWSYPFDLLSGNIKLIADATWSQKNNFRLSTKINFNDVGGNIDELVFSGLSFVHELEVLPKLHSIRSSKINLMLIDTGVTVSNISTDFRLNTVNTDALPQLVIQGLQGEILGGTFSADNFVFDLNSSKNSFNLKASNIDLAEIIKTQQLEDITATGRMDGFIPVEINEHGIFIKNGAFINIASINGASIKDRHSGTIRYNPAAATDQLKQNPLTGIALDALKDFRYSHLSAGVNYIPEGRLTINIQLKGTSPELDTSRPVHLNINTEQNLLSLLKSLRYAEGISESINKKVQRLYEKNPQ